jgi:MFS family permease
MSRLTARTWISFIAIGLVGQFAWTIENMYFNVFLYNTISTDPNYIAAMVAASAVVATLTTLLMGALSDRIGRRKILIVLGYVLWGLSTAAFRFVDLERIHTWFPLANAVSMAAVTVVVMDCVMTFFGSTANDAAFNAYVTDVTDDGNRGKAEAVLTTLPLLSMLIIFGLFDSMTQEGRWGEFFTIFGLSVSAVGILGAFLLQDRPLTPRREPYFANIVYGMRPSVIRGNRGLYLALASLAVFSIAVQVFFPYLIIYLQQYLKMDDYAVVLGIVLLAASAISVVGGRFIDKIGKLRFTIPALGVMATGLALMSVARSTLAVILSGIVMMGGYMLVQAAISATVRDLTPVDKVGHFQGIRMIFAVMLPMMVGPFIGSIVISNSSSTYVELGVVKTVPTPMIFLVAALVLLLTLLPLLSLKKETSKTGGVV